MTMLHHQADVHVLYTQQRLQELRGPAWKRELSLTGGAAAQRAGFRQRIGMALIALGGVIAGPRPTPVSAALTGTRQPGQLQLR